MTAIRRKRGEPTQKFYADISPDVSSVIDDLATRLGVPKWFVVEQAVRSIRTNTDGTPIDWSLPAAQLELPIDRVA